MLVTVVIGFIIVFIYFKYFFVDKRVKELVNKIPGPKTLPILGNAHQFHSGHEFHLQLQGFCERWRQDGIFRVWVANEPVVQIYKDEFVETLLSSTQHIDKARVYDVLVPWLGRGLLISSGDKWRVRRKMLTPSFHFNILKDFVHVFNKQSAILTNKLMSKVNNGVFNIFQDFGLCSLDIICETAMGKTLQAQLADSEYVQVLLRMSRLMDERSRKPWFASDFLYKLFGDGQEYTKKLKILHEFTLEVIADRLKTFDKKKSELVKKELSGESDESSQKVKLAFLDMLLYMSEGLTKLDMNDIREEVDTFMFEGQDTTAAAMSWATYLIGAHPEVQSKVHEELDRVFGKGNKNGAQVIDLKELKYLECCIKEALRICPSVGGFGRRLSSDLQIGRFIIPKGVSLLVNTVALHRDPQVFPDPFVFKPERFLTEGNKFRNPYSYVPFSAGPRNCIGQKFAMMEEKTVLCYIFRNFTVNSTQKWEDLRHVNDLVLRPEAGIQVELSSRL